MYVQTIHVSGAAVHPHTHCRSINTIGQRRLEVVQFLHSSKPWRAPAMDCKLPGWNKPTSSSLLYRSGIIRVYNYQHQWLILKIFWCFASLLCCVREINHVLLVLGDACWQGRGNWLNMIQHVFGALNRAIHSKWISEIGSLVSACHIKWRVDTGQRGGVVPQLHSSTNLSAAIIICGNPVPPTWCLGGQNGDHRL